jgi:putative ATP-dependent endonuclease of OLD family
LNGGINIIIKELILKNFRCFGPDEEIIKFDDLTTIIGANSSGKSAILAALLKLFGRNGNERDLKRSDFHIPMGKEPKEIDENTLSIEAIISFPELVTDNQVAEKTVPDLFQRMVVDKVDGDPYVRIRLDACWKKNNTPDGDIDVNLSFITVSREDDDDPEKNRSPAKVSDIRSNIQMIYVPAIRDPSHQLKNASGTILWRILKGINWPDNINEQIDENMKPVNSLFDKQNGVKQVQKIIQTQWRSFHKDFRYTETKIKFTDSDLNDILNKINIEFSPTEIPKSYKIDSLGEGLKSLFYLSLVNSLLELESISQTESDEEKTFNLLPPALTILAVEEPENHIAPQLLGRIIDNLDQISRRKNSQVILTSHSPSIVKRIKPESIRHLRISKENLCTKVNKILLPAKTDEAYKYIKEAVTNYPEIYFARLVVFGEGDTESIIIPKAIETLGSKIDSCGISVVPLGGRFVHHFWKLLNDIEIPFITLLDLDSERAKGGWETIKYVLNQLVKNGMSFDDVCVEGHLNQSDLVSMHTWPLNSEGDRKRIMTWVEHLESYGVYFSTPLDLDFSMLRAFKEYYLKTVLDGYGPRIPNKESELEKYNKKIEACIRNTLKEGGGDGNSYLPLEKELMLWYPYLFLDRGKPATHILAMTMLESSSLKENMPESLKKVVDAIASELKNDPFSSLKQTAV